MKVQHLLLFYTLLGVSLAQKSVVIPMLYTTPLPIDNPKPFTVTHFQMNFCKNSVYDNKSMEVSINLPYRPWSVTDGQAVTIEVFNNPDFTGSPVGDNLNSSGSPTQKFNLVYNMSWSDLYLKATTGEAPNAVYTLSISFAESFEAASNTPSTVNTRKSHHMQKAVNFDWTGKGKTLTGGVSDASPITLTQIINDFVPFKVETGHGILVNFSYCPASNVENYGITISATATDDISAVALYVCVKDSEMPCTPASAQQQYMDPSGTALASVHLSTTTQQFTQMQAAIWGWGEYQKMNSFLFTVNVDTHS